MGSSTTKMAAVRRANKEWKNVCKLSEEFAEAQFEGDNPLVWNVLLQGPEGCAYEGATFSLKFTFPTDYPFKNPKVAFSNPQQIYHPNVNEEGLICLDILKSKYSPAVSMPQVLNEIRNLLLFPSTESPLRAEVGKQYDDDREAFDQAA